MFHFDASLNNKNFSKEKITLTMTKTKTFAEKKICLIQFFSTSSTS